MDIKIKVKNVISKYNPIAVRRRTNMRNRLINKDFSFLCPNCLGGMLLHDLNLPFLSPTVNLMLHQKDFVKFVLNMNSYLLKELRFFDGHPYYVCPCAKLDDITIHFTHYATEDEAKEKWEKRIPRINSDNLFVLALEKDGMSKTDIINLGKIHAKGLVVFTAHEYPDIPYACYIPKYQEQGMVGNILVRSYIDDSKEYEQYFDFVKWFNEANGGDYDCKPYIINN